MRANMMSRAVAVLRDSYSLATAAGAQTIAITGGTVYPVSGPKIEHGTVVIANGKVVAVGTNVPVPAGATRIDATGNVGYKAGFFQCRPRRFRPR